MNNLRNYFSCICTGEEHVRLIDGRGPGDGRLEVFYNGHWGSVCGEQWTQDNTDVVCRMLRYRYILKGNNRPSSTILKSCISLIATKPGLTVTFKN